MAKMRLFSDWWIRSGELPADWRGAANNGRTAADEAEGVLVKDGCHGFVQFGQLVTELHRAFEEDLGGNGPELVIIGCSIVTEEVFGAVLLHGGEDRAGHLGEIGELLFKMAVFFGLGHEINISQRMRHFVDTHVTIGGLMGDPLHEIVPG